MEKYYYVALFCLIQVFVEIETTTELLGAGLSFITGLLIWDIIKYNLNKDRP